MWSESAVFYLSVEFLSIAHKLQELNLLFYVLTELNIKALVNVYNIGSNVRSAIIVETVKNLIGNKASSSWH